MPRKFSQLSLRDLVQWTRSRQSEAEEKGGLEEAKANMKTLKIYSMGWAFVVFLNEYKNGKYEDKFEAIMKKQFDNGDTGLPILTELFNDQELETLENEFNEYIDTIIKAAKEKRIYDGGIQSAPK